MINKSQAHSVSIGISDLKQLPHLADFFSQNLAYTKFLGKNTKEEFQFLENLQKDIAFFKKTFRFDEAKKISPSPVTSIMGAINTPVQGSQRKKKSYAASAFSEKISRKSEKLSSPIRSLKEIYRTIKRFNDEKKYSKNITLKTASFFASKPNVTQGLTTQSALSLKNKKESFRENIKKMISDKTFQKFPAKADFLKKGLERRIEESLFLILNIGNIIQTLSSNQTAQKNFSRGTVFSGEALRDDITLQTLNRLGKQETLKEAFLKNNLETAAYLLEHETLRTEILQSVSTMKNFINSAGKNKEVYSAYIVEKAQSLLNRSTFNADFLTKNLDFSSLVVGSEHLQRPFSLSQFLNANPELTKEDFDLSYLLFRYQASSVKEDLPQDVSLSENFFIKQKGILNTALSDKAFTQNLRKSINLIEQFFSSEAGTLEPTHKIDQISEAYLTGLSEQESTKIE